MFSTFPDVGNYIEKLVIMGGGVHQVNCNNCAEFNIFGDPEAASVVFNLDVDVIFLN